MNRELTPLIENVSRQNCLRNIFRSFHAEMKIEFSSRSIKSFAIRKLVNPQAHFCEQ